MQRCCKIDNFAHRYQTCSFPDIKMVQMLFIHWSVDPVIFRLPFFSLRYYTLCFLLAFVSAYVLLRQMYKAAGLQLQLLDKLLFYILTGTIAGARLGHCLLYEFGYYRHHITEMLLPFTLHNGHMVFTGYQGLASHGGAIGILLAVVLYCHRYKLPIYWLLDRLSVAVALAGAFVRTGNFFNAEIIGKPTELPWAVVFERVDHIPRHPAQLYESVLYLLLFLALYWFYRKKINRYPQGFLFGVFLITLFGCIRFLVEFVKEGQETYESGWLLNMGQLLSIPFIITGIILVISKRRPPVQAAAGAE